MGELRVHMALLVDVEIEGQRVTETWFKLGLRLEQLEGLLLRWGHQAL